METVSSDGHTPSALGSGPAKEVVGRLLGEEGDAALFPGAAVLLLVQAASFINTPVQTPGLPSH